MLRQSSYVASPNFLRRTDWNASIGQDTLFDVSGNSSKIISIIGVVSRLGLYLHPHGNFTTDDQYPPEMTKSLGHAEYIFSLSPPLEFPNFMRDFREAFNHIRAIYIPVKTPKGLYCSDTETLFINFEDNDPSSFAQDQKVFNFAFPIFRKTGLPSRDDGKWQAFRDAIASELLGFGEALFDDFDINHLSICRSGGKELKIEEFQTAMEGALVEVQFNLINVHGQGLVAEPCKIWILDEEM